MRPVAVVCAMVGVALAASCSGSTTKTSKAQWFDACDANDECEHGSCLCGVCTETCEDDGACTSAGGPAACVNVGSVCAGSGAPSSRGVCVATCAGNEDCPSGSVCRAGSCQRDTTSGSGGASADGGPNGGGATTGSGGRGRTGGATGSGSTSSSGGASGSSGSGGRPSASDFGDVDVPQDFTDPVGLPIPVPELTGDLDPLLGVWVEKTYEGKPCTQDASGNDISGTVCTRLELVKNANGTYSGTLSRQVSTLNTPRVVGPFAPASHFDVGYPTEVKPEQYGFLRDFTPGIDYRVFDGVYRDGVLSFWTSPLDIWQEWCAGQKPYGWDIDGRKEYRCVPQTADESNTDLGKMALCTSAQDLPLCPEKSGMEVPCVCIDEATGYFDSAMPLCSLSYCECSQTSCVAYTRNTSVTAHFKHTGELLSGYVTINTPGVESMDLMRISP